MTQTMLSDGQSGIGFKRARDIAAPANLGALAAKPRIQAMVQDAVWAGLLPKHLLETRLTAVIEAATSTYLSALDDDDQATAVVCSEGSSGSRRSLANNWRTAGIRRRKPDHRIPRTLPASLDEVSDDMDFLSALEEPSAPQLQAQLSRLTDRTHLRRPKKTHHFNGAWQVTRIEDLCHTRVLLLPLPLSHFGRVRGKCLGTNVQERLGNNCQGVSKQLQPPSARQ